MCVMGCLKVSVHDMEIESCALPRGNLGSRSAGARLRKRHEKTGADLIGAFSPYRAAVYLGNPLDDCQPQPIAGKVS